MAHFVAGIEGGGSVSTLVLLSVPDGRLVARIDGGASNVWLYGADKVSEELVAMVHKAKSEAGIALDEPLAALGLALSGLGQAEKRVELERAMRARDANLTRAYTLCEDTTGSIATACPNGGMVVIAGTGSNTTLLTQSGERIGAGGWGHLLGDEGSGYHVASHAMKLALRVRDGVLPDVNVDALEAALLAHFEIPNLDALLPIMYDSFRKVHVASFARVLFDLARKGDAASLDLANKSLAKLGKTAAAVVPRVPDEMWASETGLRIVGVGSLFKSFDVFGDAFLQALTSRLTPRRQRIQIVRLKETSAFGAAALAARDAHVTLQIDRDAFLDTLVDLTLPCV